MHSEPSYHHGAFSPLVYATVCANDILRFMDVIIEQLRVTQFIWRYQWFSGSKARYYGFKLKPERAKSAELVLCLIWRIIKCERHADIKINYFQYQYWKCVW